MVSTIKWSTCMLLLQLFNFNICCMTSSRGSSFGATLVMSFSVVQKYVAAQKWSVQYWEFQVRNQNSINSSVAICLKALPEPLERMHERHTLQNHRTSRSLEIYRKTFNHALLQYFGHVHRLCSIMGRESKSQFLDFCLEIALAQLDTILNAQNESISHGQCFKQTYHKQWSPLYFSRKALYSFYSALVQDLTCAFEL